MKFLMGMLISLTFISASANATEVDLKNSTFKWTGTKVSGSHFGKVKLKSATLDEKKGHINSGEFVMDMNSISCDDLQGEWMDKLIGSKNDDFFGVDKHPTAKLKVKHGMMGKMDAELTVKGITQPVTFSYKQEGKKYTGTLKFDRTKFGIKYGSGSFFDNLGDKMIHDDVTVDFVVMTK